MNKDIKIVDVTIPLSDEQLDEYFDDIESYFFYIDLDNSEYKGKQLINYIYNSGMNSAITSKKLDNNLSDLLIEYITTDKLVNIVSLSEIWVDILIYQITNEEYPEKDYQSFISKFISDNKNIINEILSILFSLKIFINKIIFDEKEYDGPIYSSEEIKKFDKIKNNFISLRNSANFWQLFSLLDSLDGKIDTNEYENFSNDSFEGNKITYFFLNEFNPISFILAISEASDEELANFKEEIKDLKL